MGASTVSKEDANSYDNHLFKQHFEFYNLWGHAAAFITGQEILTHSEPGHSGKSRGAFPLAGLGFFAVSGIRAEGGYCPRMRHAQPGFSPFWSFKSQQEQSPIPTDSSIHSTSEVQNLVQGFCSFEQTASAFAEEKEQANCNKSETLQAKRVVSPTLGSYAFCNRVTNDLGTAISASICSTSEVNSTPTSDIRTDLSDG